VVRSLLRERGLVLAGPRPCDLIDPIDPDALREEARRGLRSSADALASGATAIRALYQQGSHTLWLCRVLHTIATGEVVSKPAAVAWARASLDSRWPALIEDAWTQRERYPRGRGAPDSHRNLRPEPRTVERTLAFHEYALEFAR
jgi:hypothetical protein